MEILSAPPGATADTALGVVTGLKCSSSGCPVAQFDVVLDGNGLEGDWGGNAIVGTRNGGGGADDPMAEVLERCKGKWSVTIGRWDGGATALRMQLNVQAKGVVKVAGNWESGEAVSVSAQMVMLGEDVIFIETHLFEDGMNEEGSSNDSDDELAEAVASVVLDQYDASGILNQDDM